MKQSDIKRLLPQVFRRAAEPGSPLEALLGAMEGLHEPTEEILERLPLFFTPHAAPDPFVPLLAAWMDLDWLWQPAGRSSIGPASDAVADVRNLSCGVGRIRDLVASAAFLSRWRGTARGLCHCLELATGRTGFRVDEQVPGPDGRPRPYHIRVRAPGAADHRTLVERIVQEEKPAYVTFELSFEDPEA